MRAKADVADVPAGEIFAIAAVNSGAGAGQMLGRTGEASVVPAERELLLAARLEPVAEEFELGRQKVAMPRDLGARRAQARLLHQREETREPAPALRPARNGGRRKLEAEGGLGRVSSITALPIPRPKARASI